MRMVDRMLLFLADAVEKQRFPLLFSKGMKKTIAVFLFLVVAGLSISGGAIVIAGTMNVFVAKLDAPPAAMLPAALYKPGAKTVVLQNGERVIYEPVYVVPRKTPATAMDQALAKAQDPASTYAQKDAVGIGLFLQRQLHSALTALLHDAVRTQNVQETPMISVTSGQ